MRLALGGVVCHALLLGSCTVAVEGWAGDANRRCATGGESGDTSYQIDLSGVERAGDALDHGVELTPRDRERLAMAARRMMPCVVQVHTLPRVERATRPRTAKTHRAGTHSGGSGIVIDNAGLILTARHVVRDAEALLITLPGGRRFETDRIARHPRLDLAMLRVPGLNIESVAMAGGRSGYGEPVAAISAPSRHRPHRWHFGVITQTTVSLRNLLAPYGECDYGRLIESSTRLEAGFSSGPLIDIDGRLVGINVAAIGGLPNQASHGYAIPIDPRTRRAIAQLRRQLYDQRSEWGVRGCYRAKLRVGMGSSPGTQEVDLTGPPAGQ